MFRWYPFLLDILVFLACCNTLELTCCVVLCCTAPPLTYRTNLPSVLQAAAAQHGSAEGRVRKGQPEAAPVQLCVRGLQRLLPHHQAPHARRFVGVCAIWEYTVRTVQKSEKEKGTS